MGETLEPDVCRPGEVVRTARVRSGLTLAELGNRTGYSAAQVSRYERGVTRLTDVTVLRRFARALAISPGELGLAVTGPVGGPGRAPLLPRVACLRVWCRLGLPVSLGEGVTTCADGSSWRRWARQLSARRAAGSALRFLWSRQEVLRSGSCWLAGSGMRCWAWRRRLRGYRRALCAPG